MQGSNGIELATQSQCTLFNIVRYVTTLIEVIKLNGSSISPGYRYYFCDSV